MTGNIVGWRTDVSPSPDERRASYGPAAVSTTFSAATTREQLETRVVAMLEQLEMEFHMRLVVIYVIRQSVVTCRDGAATP